MRYFLFLTALVFLPGVVGGATSCGSCSDLPANLQDAGRKLEDSFSATSIDDLRTQRWSGELCTFHPCGDGISEDLAKELLLEYLKDSDQRNDQWFAWAGFGVSILGLLIAFFAMVWTVINDRRSRAANDRSIKNETLIEVLREERKP